MIDLGDLSGGVEMIDRVFNNTPEDVEKVEELARVSRNLHYKNYEIELKRQGSDSYSELYLAIRNDKAFIDKCYDALKPLVDVYNVELREELELKRLELIKEIK